MEGEGRVRRHRAAAIRKGDQGSYTALRWVSTLCRSAAVFLGVAVFAECVAGIRAEGWTAVPILLGEVARATVFSIVLWAGGDLIRLLLQIGRDLRAGRVLLARIAHRTAQAPASVTAESEGAVAADRVIELERGVAADEVDREAAGEAAA